MIHAQSRGIAMPIVDGPGRLAGTPARVRKPGRHARLLGFASLALFASGTLLGGLASAADQEASIAAAERDRDGLLVHSVDSPYQFGATRIRVLLPDATAPGERFPVVYV